MTDLSKLLPDFEEILELLEEIKKLKSTYHPER